MSWADATAALRSILAAADGVSRVLAVPPLAYEDTRRGVSAVLVPAARSSTRRAGPVTERVYRQRVTLLAAIGDDPQTAADAVDNAAEAIDAAMERSITLSGAVTVCGPISWDEAAAADHPPESGIWYVQMTGISQITRTVDVQRAP